MGKSFTKWHKVLIMSSSCSSYDVIKMRQLKIWRSSRVFAEYLKNGSADFTKLMSFLDNYLQYILKFKDWRQVNHCCHGNQFMRECWAKKHDLREEKWHFLKISNWYCLFELRFEIRSLKLPRTPNFSVIHPKTKKQWILSTPLVVALSKWRLWRNTFELEMTWSIFLNFTRFLPIVYSYQVSASSDLNQKKFGKYVSLLMFLTKHSPINLLPWQQWTIYPKLSILKDDLYNCLKSHKVWWRMAEPFLRYLAKTSGGHFAPPPSPSRVKLRLSIYHAL